MIMFILSLTLFFIQDCHAEYWLDILVQAVSHSLAEISCNVLA